MVSHVFTTEQRMSGSHFKRLAAAPPLPLPHQSRDKITGSRNAALRAAAAAESAALAAAVAAPSTTTTPSKETARREDEG
uniref:Uncharacterized protein n=1 Tax=Pristionchus pacificus TaxID=54126 RepID=A0A2A6BGR7_PRIPA|eukprot:PDM65084.1 hypothetical protein PRIPAC_53333 [Pristionchus pacificus]